MSQSIPSPVWERGRGEGETFHQQSASSLLQQGLRTSSRIDLLSPQPSPKRERESRTPRLIATEETPSPLSTSRARSTGSICVSCRNSLSFAPPNSMQSTILPFHNVCGDTVVRPGSA